MNLLFFLLKLGLAYAALGPLPKPVPVQPGFQAEQVQGQWTSVKLGSTNRSAIEEGGDYRCYMSSIKLLKDGNLKVTYFHRKNDQCTEEFFIGKKTAVPGQYEFDYEGKNYMTFVVVTHDFLVVDTENLSSNNHLIVVELFGRTTSVEDKGYEAYRTHTTMRGIPDKNIFDLSNHSKCVSSEP